MEVGFVILGIATVIIFGILFYLLTELRLLRKQTSKSIPGANNPLLPIQAYERLTLLADRISLKNLVIRMHGTAFTVAELQAGLVETIRNEYDHNITQQNYVNPDVWKAVTNLKEQNIYIINHLASSLQPQSAAMNLGKMILEYISNNNAELSAIVLDAIQYEVKKLL